MRDEDPRLSMSRARDRGEGAEGPGRRCGLGRRGDLVCLGVGRRRGGATSTCPGSSSNTSSCCDETFWRRSRDPQPRHRHLASPPGRQSSWRRQLSLSCHRGADASRRRIPSRTSSAGSSACCASQRSVLSGADGRRLRELAPQNGSRSGVVRQRRRPGHCQPLQLVHPRLACRPP